MTDTDTTPAAIGRPPKPEAERRRHRMPGMFSDAEREKVARDAAAAGLTMAEHIRQRLGL